MNSPPLVPAISGAGSALLADGRSGTSAILAQGADEMATRPRGIVSWFCRGLSEGFWQKPLGSRRARIPKSEGFAPTNFLGEHRRARKEEGATERWIS